MQAADDAGVGVRLVDFDPDAGTDSSDAHQLQDDG